MLSRAVFSTLAFAASLMAGGAVFAQAGTDPVVNSAHRTPPTIDASLYGGGDGASRDTAVVVLAASHPAAVEAEYAWFRYHYTGAKVAGQTFAPAEGGKQYDVLNVQREDGARRDIWFDVTAAAGTNSR